MKKEEQREEDIFLETNFTGNNLSKDSNLHLKHGCEDVNALL